MRYGDAWCLVPAYTKALVTEALATPRPSPMDEQPVPISCAVQSIVHCITAPEEYGHILELWH